MPVAFQPPKKDKLTGILAIAVYFLTGILLLVKPDLMADFTRWAMFCVLMVYAVISFVRYLKLPAEEAARGYSLTGAMIAATLAVLALFNTFFMADDIWGVMLLAGGYMKFQTAMDMGRLGHNRWWLFLIPCAISLVFGILILVGVIRQNMSVFIGIALIIEGVVDVAAMMMTARSERLNRKAEKKKAAEAPAEAAESSAAAQAPEAEASQEAPSGEAAPEESSPS